MVGGRRGLLFDVTAWMGLEVFHNFDVTIIYD